MAEIVTRAKTANSIFPLHFNRSKAPYQQLEDYCSHGLKENKLRLLRSNEPNVHRGDLTEAEVTDQFLTVSGTEEEKKAAEEERWDGCRLSGTPSCKDHARRKKPCYCRYLFKGHHIAPVYLLRIPQIGLGVFARTEIKKGEFVMDYQGEFHRTGDGDDVEGGRYSVKLQTVKGGSTDIEMDASRIGGLGRFLNHSCDANVEAYAVLVDEKVRVVIMATKDIPPFQQLCWDYGVEYFTKRGLACLCGSEECQGSYNDNGKEAREAYLKFLAEHEQIGPLGGKPQVKSFQTASKREGTLTAGGVKKKQKMDKPTNSNTKKFRGRKARRTPGLGKDPKPSTSVSASSTGGTTATAQRNQSPKPPSHNNEMGGHKAYVVNNVAVLPRLLVKKRVSAPVIPVRASARRPAGINSSSYSIYGKRWMTAAVAPPKKDLKTNKTPLTFVTDGIRNWDAMLSGLFEERNNAFPSNKEDYDLSISTLMSIYNSKAVEDAGAAESRKLLLRAEHDAQMNALRTELETERDYWRNKLMEFEGQPMNGTEAQSQHQVDDHGDEPSVEATLSGKASDSAPAIMTPTITKAEHDEIVDKLRYEMQADIDYWKEKVREMKKWIFIKTTELQSSVSDESTEGQQISNPASNFDINDDLQQPCKVAQAVKNMFQAGEDYMDVTFLTKDNCHIKAHAFLLAGMSPYFRTLLNEETKKPGYSGTITLPDVNSATLLPIREWIYTGEMDCSVDNCMEVVTAAIRFELGALVSALDAKLSSMYEREDERGSKMKTFEFCRFAAKWKKELPAIFSSVLGAMKEILFP